MNFNILNNLNNVYISMLYAYISTNGAFYKTNIITIYELYCF